MSDRGEHNGLDDPMFTPVDVPSKEKRSWYLTATGFWSATVIGGGWFVMFALRILDAIVSGHSSWFNSILLVINGLLVAGYVPSIVHFTRIRHASKSA